MPKHLATTCRHCANHALSHLSSRPPTGPSRRAAPYPSSSTHECPCGPPEMNRITCCGCTELTDKRTQHPTANPCLVTAPGVLQGCSCPSTRHAPQAVFQLTPNGRPCRPCAPSSSVGPCRASSHVSMCAPHTAPCTNSPRSPYPPLPFSAQQQNRRSESCRVLTNKPRHKAVHRCHYY